MYNKALAEILFRNIEAVGKPQYTSEEERFSWALQEAAGLPVKGINYPLALVNTEQGPETLGGSDVGDVCRCVPTGCVRYPAVVPGSRFHEWPVTATGATSIAHKGISAGAKAVAFTIHDLMMNPEWLSGIKREFHESTRQRPYKSFLPEDARPPLGF